MVLGHSTQHFEFVKFFWFLCKGFVLSYSLVLGFYVKLILLPALVLLSLCHPRFLSKSIVSSVSRRCCVVLSRVLSHVLSHTQYLGLVSAVLSLYTLRPDSGTLTLKWKAKKAGKRGLFPAEHVSVLLVSVVDDCLYNKTAAVIFRASVHADTETGLHSLWSSFRFFNFSWQSSQNHTHMHFFLLL